MLFPLSEIHSCLTLRMELMVKLSKKVTVPAGLPKIRSAGWSVGWLVEGLVGWLYGISTFVGYLTPNPFLCKKSALFQTNQFSMSTQFNLQKRFYFKLSSLFQLF